MRGRLGYIAGHNARPKRQIRNEINGLCLAEREGFEPPIELPLCRISSAVHSTALPSLREIERARRAARLVDTGGLMA